MLGFILSFTFFTLFLATIVKLLGIPSPTLRVLSIIIVFGFGLSLLIPQFQAWTERIFGKLTALAPKKNTEAGFFGGLILGLSIGLLWTPCVGPILASVIALAATSVVTINTFLITLAYSLGTSIPMLLIIIGGRKLLTRTPWFTNNTQSIQKVFGIIMICVAFAMFFNVDQMFQTYILTTFPSYGTGLTKIEEYKPISNALLTLRNNVAKQKRTTIPSLLSAMKPSAPDFIAGGQWFNSKPLTLASLRGKVVLIDFWTYTCINCIRTLPYTESWYKKYADKGFVVVGVHTPEFEFEKDSSNVKQAISNFGITYPVMQDNNYATWNAYNNQYWPAEYFIDADGKIRFTHFGEGNFDESEQRIQQLLTEAGATVSGIKIQNSTYSIDALTPETYVGLARMERFSSPENISVDTKVRYTTPKTLVQDQFALDGLWTVSQENAKPEVGAKLNFAFNAKDVYLVMKPKGTSLGKIAIYLDGKGITSDVAGEDVINGTVTVGSDRLYRLVKLPKGSAHLLQIIFLDANIEVYAFTFG